MAADSSINTLLAAILEANGGVRAPVTLDTRFWLVCPAHPGQGRMYRLLANAVREGERHGRWCREADVLILDRMHQGRAYDRRGRLMRAMTDEARENA